MLPYEAPLYNAFDALASNDLELAESEIVRFFAALESDPMAVNCRQQHINRQMFEADFLSILIKEEIDAWYVLSAVHIERQDWKRARDACYRQIELIDQHYGFSTPSWECPESRIPCHQELAELYTRLASHLTTICTNLGDVEMSARWAKIMSCAATDRINPDEVWGRWIAEEGDFPEPIGISIFEFSDWTINPTEVDGKIWLVNLYSMLTQRASPRDFSTLVSVHVQTDPTCDMPSKEARWRIWSLRQAIASRLVRNGLGIRFGELQNSEERVLLFYAASEEGVLAVTESVLAAASDLAPRLEMRTDESWKEYSKWSGVSILVGSPTAVHLAADPEEHENDAFLREVWSQCQSLTNVWSKMYGLLWVADLVPPKSEATRKYCVDFFFELLNYLSGSEKEFALWHMVWKLPSVDPEAAVRALDMIQLNELVEANFCTANFAAEALAECAYDRALNIVNVLRQRNYSLIHKAAGKVAVSMAGADPKRSLEVIEATHEFIRHSNEQPYSKVRYLTELSCAVRATFPEAARDLLIDAIAIMPTVDERSTRAQMYQSLLASARAVAPDLLPKVCRDAVESAFALMKPSQHWMDFAGPTMAVNYICWFVPYVAHFNKSMALEILTEALDIVVELNDEEQSEALPSLAEAASTIGAEMNETLVVRLWKILEDLSQKNRAGVLRSFYLNRCLPGKPTPAEAFVEMNPPLAAQKIVSIEAICELAVLPEVQVDLLASFAKSMFEFDQTLADYLICRAGTLCQNCSSPFLIAIAYSRVVAVMRSIGLDPDGPYWLAIEAFDSIESPRTRIEALIESAKQCAEDYPEFADHLLERALAVAVEVREVTWSSDLIEDLYGLKGKHASALFLKLIECRENDSRLTEQLSRFAAGLAGSKYQY